MKDISRGDIKKNFVKNSIPTQEHFEELVDAQLNLFDDGFVQASESDPIGLRARENGKVLRLCNANREEQWNLRVNEAIHGHDFSIRPDNGVGGLRLTRVTLGADTITCLSVEAIKIGNYVLRAGLTHEREFEIWTLGNDQKSDKRWSYLKRTLFE